MDLIKGENKDLMNKKWKIYPFKINWLGDGVFVSYDSFTPSLSVHMALVFPIHDFELHAVCVTGASPEVGGRLR
ncbi:MAG: hypothetical protein ACRCTP_16420 [Aeromonas popoffii]|uniref:hypothetical protein n=1 Tax=Aeromonas popoffii TaxID=70856 RepID=UPI003F345607